MELRAGVLAVVALAATLTGCSGSSSDDPQEPLPTPQQPQPEPPSSPEESTPTVSVTGATVDEAGGPVSFRVQAEGPNLAEVSVDYATSDGSARAGADFISRSGSLTFTDDAAEQLVDVDVLDDAEPEEEETFTLELSNPVNAEIAGSPGVATIVDDDGGAEICGAPELNDALDNEAFLWKDCAAGVWHLTVTSAGESRLYQGSVSSSNGFGRVEPVDIEDDDEVATPSGSEVTFSLQVAADRDTIEFETRHDAGTCLSVTQGSSTTVLLGSRRTSVESPFDLATQEPCDIEPSPAPATEYNFVVLFTDDQRFDTLAHMPNVSTRLLPHGVEFTNAYVSTPLCCPARASTWSGGFFTHNTGVLDNNGPNGGMADYHDAVNIGTQLQTAGYLTLFVGKWLNDYPKFSPYVPPGWSRFLGRSVYATTADWSSFSYGSGTSGSDSATGTRVDTAGQYHVYFERDQILDFLQTSTGDEPFLVVWSTTAPHAPMIPDERDQDKFSDFTYRGRAYGETDLSDKPEWVANPSPNTKIGDDEEVRNQLRSMLSVDRGLASIVDLIAEQGKLDETVFIITSDNGYMWGEHGLWAKNKPYEEALRVPLLVVMPGIEPRADDRLVYGNLDLAPTLYDLAGISADSDGTSLVPLLRDPATDWRNELYFEKLTTSRSVNGMWTGLRQDNWKYVEYFNGEKELYDLDADPFELENLSADSSYADIRAALADRLEDLRGLGIKPLYRINTDGRVGTAYELPLQAWGGEAPLQWTLESGELPPGLSLDSATGVISGTPTTAGTWTFRARVTSAAIARQTQQPMSFISEVIAIEIQ